MTEGQNSLCGLPVGLPFGRTQPCFLDDGHAGTHRALIEYEIMPGMWIPAPYEGEQPADA